MNLICIPYHDWRKIELEGARTRDAHLVYNLLENPAVEKILLINRPTSLPELLVHKKQFKLNGKVLIKDGGLALYQITEKLFVVDYITGDLLSPVIKRRLWAFDSFGYGKLISFFFKCINYLNMNEYQVFTNNIFSLNFAKKIKSTDVVFDAYDNLVFFPNNKGIKPQLEEAYRDWAKVSKFWTTNSTKNVNYYEKFYKQKNCFLIKNGVDIEIFSKQYRPPVDLLGIASPIIGFGGKISHLFDYELFNYCVDRHTDKSFVIVGQILDKEVFSKISTAANVHYLGDKHYSDYPSYVCNFNIGIVPYVTSDLESGVDSIKMYEYLAAGLSSIGTMGGGMPDLAEYIYLAKSKEEFSEYIDKALLNAKEVALPESHTWKYKAQYLLSLMAK